MKVFVTGAAGFIGSNVVDAFLADGHEVTGYDNFVTGRLEFLESARRSERFTLIEADLEDRAKLNAAVEGRDLIIHLAANADVRFGTLHPRKDLEQNTICTWNVLEAMRLAGVNRIAFSSTGSVYGEPSMFPTPEDAPFPVQTSLYGASKLAAEGLICAYAEGYGIEAHIFRFVSLLGARYTHGHVVDFYRQLRDHPDRLHVLGNGKQRKSYLHVSDCVKAMRMALEKARGKINIFNLGTDEYCEVNDSIGWICRSLGVSPAITYGGGDRGWIGDSPLIFLDCAKIRSLGWTPELSIRESVELTVRYLQGNAHVTA
ncbi:MAG: NAD-dependent epimerase/dehydratase family protein [Bryobacterales bacterium]|nr:NAD-dependent epimerase/dehydratase family protein [Bryobacterales bacterium]